MSQGTGGGEGDMYSDHQVTLRILRKMFFLHRSKTNKTPIRHYKSNMVSVSW